MNNERRNIKELETLSAYLDGELSPEQSRALETRLQKEPQLQARLEALRQTKLILGYLPHLPAPRNYTLTPEMVQARAPKSQPFVPTLRLASALAAILLVVLFGVEFLFTSGPLASPRSVAEPMMEAAMIYDEEAEPEPLIIWGQLGVGGAEGPADGLGGFSADMEAPVTMETLPVEPEVVLEEAPVFESQEEALPEEEPEFPLGAEALPEAEVEVETLRIAPEGEKGLPILGINTEEGGEIIHRTTDSSITEVREPAWRTALRVLQITLAVVAVGGGLAWWLLRQRG